MQAEKKMTSKAPIDLSEYDAISRTVQIYVDGGKSGRGGDMKPAFHPDATIFGYVGPDLFAGPINNFLTGMIRMVRPRNSSPELPASTSSKR